MAHAFLLFAGNYSLQKHTNIGACMLQYMYCAAAVARHFLNKMGTSVTKSTIKSIKSCYKDELGKQWASTGSSVVKSLPLLGD